MAKNTSGNTLSFFDASKGFLVFLRKVNSVLLYRIVTCELDIFRRDFDMNIRKNLELSKRTFTLKSCTKYT